MYKSYRHLYGMPETAMSKQAAFKAELAAYFKKLNNGQRPFQKTAAEKKAIVAGLLNKVTAGTAPSKEAAK